MVPVNVGWLELHASLVRGTVRIPRVGTGGGSGERGETREERETDAAMGRGGKEEKRILERRSKATA